MTPNPYGDDLGDRDPLQAYSRTAEDIRAPYTSLRRLNAAMFRGLTREQLAIPFRHPEYGLLNVGWILAQMAGHDIHHLKQLKAIA